MVNASCAAARAGPISGKTSSVLGFHFPEIAMKTPVVYLAIIFALFVICLGIGFYIGYSHMIDPPPGLWAQATVPALTAAA